MAGPAVSCLVPAAVDARATVQLSVYNDYMRVVTNAAVAATLQNQEVKGCAACLICSAQCSAACARV
jgi:hypothetical protein